jgi:hypothetical protein
VLTVSLQASSYPLVNQLELAQMATQGTKVAYSGHPPGYVPQRNAFDWALGQPFQQPSDHTPPNRVVPAIEANRAIFVDDKTGSDTLTISDDSSGG